MGVAMQVTAGPDGFLTTSGDPGFALNVVLTDYLRATQEEGDKALETTLPRLRKELSKRELVSLIGVIHRRLAWIEQHEHELAEPQSWQRRLSRLAKNLYSPKLPFEAADLASMVAAHRVTRALWWFGPEELVVAFAETHDLPPELATELRRYQAELKGKFQNQAGYQVAVQHVHMLLWHDENDPFDPKHCWSETIRGDLREMTGPARTHWKALFRHIKGNAPAKPSKGWQKEAQARLAAIGEKEFVDRLAAWFAPFQRQVPQSLSVPGSHVLRGLLWYAALIDDPALGPILLMLLDAKWKAKRNVEKTMVALVGVLAAQPPAVRWAPLQRLQLEWGTTSGQIEDLLRATAGELGISADELRAQGLLKSPPGFGDLLDKMMERLQSARFAIGIVDPRAR